MSAKSGENVIRAFYQAAGEVVGLRLTAHELAFHDKVRGGRRDAALAVGRSLAFFLSQSSSRFGSER